MAFIKNEAILGFPFELLDIGGNPITSGTVAGYYLLDGGAQTSLTGTATHEGNGQWSWDTIPAAATNGDLLGLLFVHANGRASFTLQLATSPDTSLTVGTPGEVEICNLALVEGLGDQPIVSLEDDSNRARSCKRLYPICRDELIVDLAPGFAVKRVQLAQLATGPVSEFTYRYQLPTDCLQSLETEEGYPWRREANTVVTDASTTYLKYLARVTDTSLFSPPFTRALTAYLQARLAFAITKSASMAEQSWKLFEMEKENASAIEGQEGTAKTLAPTTLTDVRR
jgi:hypothetical protein